MKYKSSEDNPADPLIVEETRTHGLESPAYWVERITAGLPVAEFDALREMLGLSVEEMAEKIGISVATLSRRRSKEQPLDRDHSDRLMRYARLYWQSVHYFNEDLAAGAAWLKRPARALAGKTPLQFAETEIGAREVEDLLGRLEYGVYA